MKSGHGKSNSDPWRSGSALSQATIDAELDAALAGYSAVDPRPGLEARILANLRAERRKPGLQKSWRLQSWRWTAAFALAAILLAVVGLLWRSEKSRHNDIAHSHSHATQAGSNQKEIAEAHSSVQERVPQPVFVKRPRPARALKTVTPSEPRLDRFPSPRPLSEQETILASYVANFPAHAALIAEARTESLRHDLAEEMNEGSGRKDFQP